MRSKSFNNYWTNRGLVKCPEYIVSINTPRIIRDTLEKRNTDCLGMGESRMTIPDKVVRIELTDEVVDSLQRIANTRRNGKETTTFNANALSEFKSLCH